MKKILLKTEEDRMLCSGRKLNNIGVCTCMKCSKYLKCYGLSSEEDPHIVEGVT